MPFLCLHSLQLVPINFGGAAGGGGGGGKGGEFVAEDEGNELSCAGRGFSMVDEKYFVSEDAQLYVVEGSDGIVVCIDFLEALKF